MEIRDLCYLYTDVQPIFYSLINKVFAIVHFVGNSQSRKLRLMKFVHQRAYPLYMNLIKLHFTKVLFLKTTFWKLA